MWYWGNVHPHLQSATDRLAQQSTTYISQLTGGKWVPASSQGRLFQLHIARTISYTYDAKEILFSRTDELATPRRTRTTPMAM